MPLADAPSGTRDGLPLPEHRPAAVGLAAQRAQVELLDSAAVGAVAEVARIQAKVVVLETWAEHARQIRPYRGGLIAAAETEVGGLRQLLVPAAARAEHLTARLEHERESLAATEARWAALVAQHTAALAARRPEEVHLRAV